MGRQIKKKKRLLFVLLFLSFRFFLNGQEALSREEPPLEVLPEFPFVSELQGELKNNLLRLSWIDAPLARGPVYIYRSGLPFGDELNPAALGRPVAVPYGVQYYIDEIEGPGIYYYFVAASDETGRRFLTPVPCGNCISIDAGFFPGEPDMDMADSGTVQRFPQPADGGGLRDIRAEVDGSAVIITFSSDEKEKAILYRSVAPLRASGDLLRALIIEPDASSPYIDHPVPGIPYYYALVSGGDIISGNILIRPGRNATAEAVEVPMDDAHGPSMEIRNLPLPLVSLAAAASGTAALYEIPKSEELSAEAARALESLGLTAPKRSSPKEAQIFAEDLEAGGEGEGYILGSIVKDSFSGKDWTSAGEKLSSFLSLPRTEAAEARARFYLGQCRYFSYMPREALFEFLKAQPVYPGETAGWIQATLTMMIE